MKLLAIESSCDDTAAAVLDDGAVALEHRRLAGRRPPRVRRRRPGARLAQPHARHHADHRRARSPTPASTLDDIDAVAATYGPGLVGSLLVGLCAAKAIAYARRPAVRRRQPSRRPPAVGAARAAGRISRTSRCWSPAATPASTWRARSATTRCSAPPATTPPARRSTRSPSCSASAIPGGRVIDALARAAIRRAIRFPRARLKSRAGRRGASTSASAASRPRSRCTCASTAPTTRDHPDIAASFQEAVIDMLLDSAFAAARRLPRVGDWCIAGGVSANSRLRDARRRRRRRARPRAHHPVAALLHRQRGDDRPSRRTTGWRAASATT